MKTLRSDLVFIWLLATTALCVGLIINQFRDTPVPLVYKDKAERLQDSVTRIAAQPPAAPIGTQVVQLPEKLSLEEFSVYVSDKSGLILDARPEIFHRLGHVPGAISLPRDEFETGYALVKTQLEANRSQPIVLYCASSSCEDAGLVKTSLTALGFTNIAIFEGGWSAWTTAKKPEETNR